MSSEVDGGITAVLERIRDGNVSVAEAEGAIAKLMPELAFRSISSAESPSREDPVARFDTLRKQRTNVPEVVFGEGKSVDQLLRIFQSLLDRGLTRGDAMATRVSRITYKNLCLEDDRLKERLVYRDTARICYLNSIDNDVDDVSSSRKIAVVSAGTSDAPIADEAAVAAELMCHGKARVERVNDVGVAGIHRVLSQLDRIQDADVVICVAGMDGALPSVLGGLLSCPVVAVPTSVGYGAAWSGLAPLLTMLNSCAPGVAVMNIDNGFGAAAFATKLILGGRPPSS